MYKEQRSFLKRLTITWFGLVALNICLNLPGIEDLFESDSKVTVHTLKICTDDLYTKNKNSGSDVLFTSLSLVVGNARDESKTTGLIAGDILLEVGVSYEKANKSKSLHEFKRNIFSRSRAPPTV